MAITNAPVIPNAIMVDAVIGQMATALKSNLSWLDAAFGRAQRLTKVIEGKRYTTPNVYIGGNVGQANNDYIPVSPDSRIGNFCFFLLEDPEQLDWNPYRPMKTTTPFSLIFWFDLRRVYNSATNRNTEKLKAQILYVLNGRTNGWHLNGGEIKINKVWERAENIYKGFTIDEIDNQFLMHPYAGFRFDGTLSIETPCTL